MFYKRSLAFVSIISIAISLGVSPEPLHAQVLFGSRSRKGMASIAGGTFTMGTDAGKIPELMKTFNVRRAEIFNDETPNHSVKVSGFNIDKYEVTNSEFRRFLMKHREWQKHQVPADRQNGKYLQDWKGNDYPRGKDDFPVVFVTWYAAVAYCRSQGKRLPTEAEWEFAARGGLTDSAFPWGNEPPDKSRANYGASSIGAATHVGSYPANGYRLFDMAGNVWEFLADEWAKYAVTPTPQTDPVAGNDFFERGESFLAVRSRRVIRGGSWGGSPINLRMTYRDSHPPDGAGDHVGFRCAVSG